MDPKKSQPIFGHVEKFLEDSSTFQKVVGAARAWKRITTGNHTESPRYYNFLIGRLLRNITQSKSAASRITQVFTGAFFHSSAPNAKQIKEHLEENVRRIETLDLNRLDESEMEMVLGVLPKNLEHVQTLNLDSSSLTSKQFQTLLSRVKNLSRLHVGRNQSLSESDFYQIAQLKHLKILDLHECEQVTNAFLDKITDLPLTSINFRLCSKVTDEGLKKILTSCKDQLRFLNLIACPIHDETLCQIKEHCHMLTDLFLGLNSHFSSEALMDMLLTTKHLEFLHLTSIATFNDSHLESLDLPHLIHLNIYGCDKISIEGVTRALEKHQNLQDCILSLPRKGLDYLKNRFGLVNFNFNNSLQSW